MPSALVSTAWLSENLGNPRIKILDASYFPPNIKRNARQEYEAAHIPGALFFDIDDIADKTQNLPHMLPAAEVFAEKISALGISNQDFVVAYDSTGIFSAPRAWWMFRAMGHANVAVLDGGLPKWQRENHPVTTDLPTPAKADFKAVLQGNLLRGVEDIAANLHSRQAQIIDARSAGQFWGKSRKSGPAGRPGIFRMPKMCLLPAFSHQSRRCLPQPLWLAVLARLTLTGR